MIIRCLGSKIHKISKENLLVRERTLTCNAESTVDPVADLGWLVVNARDRLIGQIDEMLAPLDLTAAQYSIIVNIAKGRNTPAQLCERLCYDRGAMTRLLDRLYLKGLLIRLPSATDGRSITLKLTVKGEALFPRILPMIDDFYRELLADFSCQEAKQLAGLLCRLIGKMS